MTEITTDLILKAYTAGLFPMAENREDPDIFWVEPKMRGILPLDDFHASKRLIKKIRQGIYRVTINKAFDQVIDACSNPRPGHEDTWINPMIKSLYSDLHEQGFVHSIECWDEGELVGGLYGVAIGGAFFGESMFHRKTDASKIALCYLVARLKAGHFKLLDTQFQTDHLKQFGTMEIPKDEYLIQLDAALQEPEDNKEYPDFYSLGEVVSPPNIVQLITHTS